MKNSADEDPTLAGFIENDMLALLDPAKTWMDRVACPPKIGSLSDVKKAFNKTIQIKIGLCRPPHIRRIVGNVGEVKFG